MVGTTKFFEGNSTNNLSKSSFIYVVLALVSTVIIIINSNVIIIVTQNLSEIIYSKFWYNGSVVKFVQLDPLRCILRCVRLHFIFALARDSTNKLHSPPCLSDRVDSWLRCAIAHSAYIALHALTSNATSFYTLFSLLSQKERDTRFM